MSRSRPNTDFVRILASAGILEFLLLGALPRAGESSPASTRQDPDPGVRELYLTHCAACHGETGDGKGTTELDRPARSFLDGGFSFGNTPKALMRTLTNGIPGTPMPAFDEALSEDERGQLAAYVISLGPEGTPEAPKGTEIVVEDRARVVRGMMGAVAKGAPSFPRGVLVGTPDGMSFQYRADDVRLLAVRLGSFVDRRDWANRGGSPLAPLGQVVHLFGGGNPRASFELAGGGGAERAPLRAQLVATEERGPEAVLEYELIHEDSGSVARVRESARAVGFSHGAGFMRAFQFEVTDPSMNRALIMDLGATAGTHPSQMATGERSDPSGIPIRWLVLEREDGLLDCIGTRTLADDRAVLRRDGLRVALPLRLEGESTLSVESYLLTIREWNDEVRRALTTEVGR